MSQAKKIYMHPGQLEIMSVGANVNVLIAPRGWGKSSYVDAPYILRNVFAMPGSVGAILSPTYLKLLTNTLPPVTAAWKKFGYFRDVHYVIGKKAPKKLNFAMPHTEPESWEHTIHWYNGTVIQMLSFDRNMSANSMNIDWFVGFEARYLSRQKIKEEVTPANRGNRDKFPNCPWHHGYLLTSDMPTNKDGSWLFEYEKMPLRLSPDFVKKYGNVTSKQLIDIIKITKSELIDLKQKPDTLHYQRLTKEKTKELNIFRENAIYYREADPFDNLPVLGEKFFRNMRRDLPPLLFRTSVLNKRMDKIENGFYSSLNESVHVYVSNDNSFLDYTDYDTDKLNEPDCRKDADIDKEQPLSIALDYNAAINNIVCGQAHARTLRTLSSMYVKTPQKIDDLVINFCKYYRHMPIHEVTFYYDHTAVWKTPLDNISLADAVMQAFDRNGWVVNGVYIGQAIRHDLKYLYINKALRGDTDYLFPTFNRDNNPYLLPAMNLTGVRQGPNGFEKDKSMEKEADTPDYPDQQKTHVTDAWDTLFIGLNNYPQQGTTMHMASVFNNK